MNYKFTNENGKTYSGTAGLLHEIKLEGGYDSFIKNRELAAISSFLDSSEAQEIIEEKAKSYSARAKIKVKHCG